MKIAILNAEAGGNKGAEAMLEVLILELSKRIPEAELFLEYSSKLDYYKNIFLPRFDNNKVTLMRFTPKNFFNPFDIDIDQIDFAIDIGGISFHDGSIRASIRNFIRFLPFVKSRGKLIFFTQDFGPSRKLLNKFLAKIVLSRSLGIFTRSHISKQEVIKNFKIKPVKVFGPFPDSTLIFQPKIQENIDFGIDNQYVVFSPSAIMYSKYGKDYIDFFVELYKNLSKRYTILLLVHNFTLNDQNSDNEVCLMLKELCLQALLFNENVSTSFFKNILKKARFSVSSRYHVVVGSVSQNIPSLAIGWNPKYESFLNLYNKTNWNLKFNANLLNECMECINLIESNVHFEEIELKNKELKKLVNDSFENLQKLISK